MYNRKPAKYDLERRFSPLDRVSEGEWTHWCHTMGFICMNYRSFTGFLLSILEALRRSRKPIAR